MRAVARPLDFPAPIGTDVCLAASSNAASFGAGTRAKKTLREGLGWAGLKTGMCRFQSDFMAPVVATGVCPLFVPFGEAEINVGEGGALDGDAEDFPGEVGSGFQPRGAGLELAGVPVFLSGCCIGHREQF